MSPYYFTFHLRHADDHSQVASVRLVQYPAIYVTRILSGLSDELGVENTTRFVNSFKENGGSETDKKGFTGGTTNNSVYFVGSLNNNRKDCNRNIYTIHISRFASLGDDYMIADPRQMTVNNYPIDGGDWSRKGKNVAGVTDKYLTHYYPTKEGAEYSRYIAPSFSVASQWGATVALTLDQARRRCASYQEEYRPAGRWRIPTFAEIRFIANLSANKLIPYLFGTEGSGSANYWTGSGAVAINSTNNTVVEYTTTDALAVRCVYDDWYWGKDNAKTNDFTWGDRPRDISRSRSALAPYRKSKTK